MYKSERRWVSVLPNALITFRHSVESPYPKKSSVSISFDSLQETDEKDPKEIMAGHLRLRFSAGDTTLEALHHFMARSKQDRRLWSANQQQQQNDMARTTMSVGPSFGDLTTTMDSTASAARYISSYTKRTKTSLPNVDKVMMIATSDCAGKYPRKEARKKRESSLGNSLSHVLFPSRCPPPVTKKETAKPSPLALTIDSFAAAKISPSGGVLVANCPPKRSLRQTLHRRNKHLFVSSHSPTKSTSCSSLSSSSSSSSSSSPSKARGNSKVKHSRKHHRRHNLALNAMDFESLGLGLLRK